MSQVAHAVILPAVVRALNAIASNFAHGKGHASVGAAINQGMGLTGGIPKQH
jgi:hypothetical protein